jgi:hypothetical protein
MQSQYDAVLRRQPSPSLSACLLWEKRLALASRMYLSAAKALAQVRRLQLPLTLHTLHMLQVALPGATQVGQAGQLNVADKQINLAATAQTQP